MTSPVSPPPRGSARLALLLTHPLCLALLVRSLGLLLPHTYFQPDEFWQALEPAHVRVFGYGFLSWEWRALPGSTLSTGSAGLEWGRTGTQGVLADAYERWVIRGQLRSWAWPGVFVGVYKALRLLGLDETEWLVSPVQPARQRAAKLKQTGRCTADSGRARCGPDGLDDAPSCPQAARSGRVGRCGKPLVLSCRVEGAALTGPSSSSRSPTSSTTTRCLVCWRRHLKRY